MKIKDNLVLKIDDKLKKYKLYQQIKSGFVEKTIVFSCFGTILTLIFAVFNGAYGIIYNSIWYIAFSCYYFILALQKFLLLLIYKIKQKKYLNDEVKFEREKQKISLINAIFFIPSIITLSVIVSMLLCSKRPITSNSIMAITTATYAFYKITMSLINLVKAKKSNDKIAESLRSINLVDALTSIILLESTLISNFGTLTYEMIVLIALSGLFVCMFILILSLYIIINSYKKLKTL